MTALAALAGCEAALGQVVNVGSQQEITIAALADLVKEVMGFSPKIVLVPYDQAYEDGF